MNLPVTHLRAKDYADMERQLLAIFRAVLFAPVLKIMDEANAQVGPATKQLGNAGGDALRAALKSGRVQYQDGIFSGVFNRRISDDLIAIGAAFDSAAKVYRLDAMRVPIWVKAESAGYQAAAKAAHEALLRQLDDIQAGLEPRVEEHPLQAVPTIDSVVQGFVPMAKRLEIAPGLDATSRQRLAADYSTNMRLWVKRFSEAQIIDLRKMVEANASQGYRFDKLVDGVRDRYFVSVNKARFLARQETSLFMSKYHQQRYAEAGVSRYIWSTSEDARVRPALNLTPAQRRHAGNHRRLNNKVYAFNNPPVVDPHTGRRANPGEDYNCRCIAVPVLIGAPAPDRPAEVAA